jgi:hypothetical protein
MTNMDAIHARITICNLKARHLRLLDTKDWAGYAALLTDDFELDISAASPGAPILRGRDVVVAALKAQLDKVTMAHHAHEPEIELQGDEALVVWAMQDRIIRDPAQPSFRGYGHHHDRWVRRDGHWRLAAQRVTRLHVDIVPPAPSRP